MTEVSDERFINAFCHVGGGLPAVPGTAPSETTTTPPRPLRSTRPKASTTVYPATDDSFMLLIIPQNISHFPRKSKKRKEKKRKAPDKVSNTRPNLCIIMQRPPGTPSPSLTSFSTRVYDRTDTDMISTRRSCKTDNSSRSPAPGRPEREKEDIPTGSSSHRASSSYRSSRPSEPQATAAVPSDRA